MRIVRRGTGSVLTWLRAQMVLLSAQGMDVAAMPASIGYLVIDTTDPQRLTPFWCGLLDVNVDTTIGDGQFVVLSRTKDGLTVGFQHVSGG